MQDYIGIYLKKYEYMQVCMNISECMYGWLYMEIYRNIGIYRDIYIEVCRNM